MSYKLPTTPHSSLLRIITITPHHRHCCLPTTPHSSLLITITHHSTCILCTPQRHHFSLLLTSHSCPLLPTPAHSSPLLPAPPTQVLPLTKLKSVARRWHDKHLMAKLDQILADPELALIQWLPDVYQVGVRRWMGLIQCDAWRAGCGTDILYLKQLTYLFLAVRVYH